MIAPPDGVTAIDILPTGTDLTAAATTTDRLAQIKDAINNQSSKTAVAASIDATSGKLVLTSSHDITVAGALATAATGFSATLTATAATVTGFSTLDLSSVAGANLAMQYMDSALSAINSSRATLGAVQNRFSSVVSNLQTIAENLTASRSRIQDTDFAAETATLTRSQILQQAGTAMLAQANALPNNVLTLLRG